MIARQIALVRKTTSSRWPIATYTTASVARHASLAVDPKPAEPELSSSAPLPAKPKRTRFLPYAYASSSSVTRLPTPLPADAAERAAALRKYLSLPKTGATTGSDAESPALSFGDLAGLAMSSADDAIFPASKSVEYVGILRACLGTGLTNRAHKLFTDLRNKASARTKLREVLREKLKEGLMTEEDWHEDLQLNDSDPTNLEIWTYNSMLQAYMRKAYQADSMEGTLEWLNRSWYLWQDMVSTAEIDPSPNAATFAIMMRGVVTLQRASRYPSTAPSLEALIKAVKASPHGFDNVLTSSPFNPEIVEDPEHPGSVTTKALDKSTEGEVDARLVLHSLIQAAGHLGESEIVRDLDTVQGILDGREALSKLPVPTQVLDDVPELLPVKSKQKASRSGDNSQSVEGELPYNLVSLKDNLTVVQEARKTISDPYERQKWLEHSAVDTARKSLQHSADKMEVLGLQSTSAMQTRPLQAWMWEWFNKLQVELQEDIQRQSATDETADHDPSQARHEEIIQPFLRLLPPSKLAIITVLELMRMSGNGGVTDGMKTTRALLSVGRAIEMEYQSEVIRKNPRMFQNAYATQSFLRKRGLIDMNARKEVKNLKELVEEESVMASIPKWTQTVRARVGSYLVQKLMKVAMVNRKATDRDGQVWEETQPAFYSTYQYLAGKKLGVIKLNEVIATRLDKDSVQETLHPRHLPMLVPPKPWTSHNAGGYYSVRQSAMRFKDSAEQGSYLRAASNSGDLDTVLAALDVLGNTSWQINRPVFDVMTTVWNSGLEIADMPPLGMDVPEPQKPDNYDHDLKARSVYLQRLKQYNQQKANNHSRRCDVNYKLEIARAYLGERFYFPHNMDFRGRAYPMPPHLNHIGNDLCRGLLMFAETKPLGAVGLRWLRIHISNVFGYDKASFAEREQFAIDKEASIRDSAERPLDGDRWWLKADDPWQCLAACMELKAALDHAEGPEAYQSSLPVHQDGTCNGLQHYAALGGDLAGAKQVNLSQGERPSDVYTAIADLVIDALESAAAKGDELAVILQGKVTRKVVKQTVMTTVYGVTFIGAKNQVKRQLADRGDVPAEDLFRAASYLAKIIMSCIGNLFTGAQSIQGWLSTSARMIAKSIPPQRIEEALRPVKTTRLRAGKSDNIIKEQMTSVIWTTALGLPVVQPYRKMKKRQVMTTMQTVYIEDPLSSSEVSPSKQASAFPPNFIHSLDATHMILTALECHAAGLTFASVHDSYWTHACDIDTMSDMIRETFVRLHTQDILHRLREEFLERYKGYKVPVSSLRSLKVLRKDERPPSTLGDTSNNDAGEIVDLSEDLDNSIQDTPIEDGPIQDTFIEDTPIQDTFIEDTPIEDAPKKTGKKTEADLEKAFKAKFVDLADILPPIPAKGSFDVNETKQSLYFFS